MSALQNPRVPLPLWIGFWLCVLIAIAVVVRRVLAFAEPTASGNSAMNQINGTFAGHMALTLAHIVPAAIFVILAVAVLLLGRPARLLQVAFFLFGVITGLTAYAMNAYAIGGWVERSAVIVFDTWFLISLARAWILFTRHQYVQQREWTLRAVVILLGIATTRPVMGIFFATSRLTHLEPRAFFGVAFWIGFAINVAVVELWLHRKNRGAISIQYSPEYPRTV